jgi:hypothetical protein
MHKTSILICVLFFSPVLAAQSPAPDDWTHLLSDPRFIPAIKACLALHPKGQGPAVVSRVGHVNLEEVAVMTTDPSGRRNACHARKDTGADGHSRTLFDAAGPLFLSADQASVAPKGECIESTPVYIDQQLQGWIVRQPQLDSHLPNACSSPDWTGLLPSNGAPPTQQDFN